MSIIVYKITGFNINMYCKLTEYGINTDKYMCSMSFGSGRNKYCLNAIYKAESPYEIYIDRIEINNSCTINSLLSDFDEGLVKLVKTALFTMKKAYPHVLKYKLHDDSHIICDGINNKFKLSLAYDYILKYNQTWYENKFNAELPGLLSNKKIEDGSLMENYLKSLKILGIELIPYDIITSAIPVISNYKNEYNTATSPRTFITNIRKTYKDKYCFEVSKWLNGYMKFLQIKLSPEYWFINTSNILNVPNFNSVQLSNNTINKIFNRKGGGISNKTLKQKGDIFSIGRATYTESYM